MKKRICLAICTVLLLLSLAGCGNNSLELPKGHGNIYVQNGNFYGDAEFEYINETTIKITQDDGTVIYVPAGYISKIIVDNKN